MKVEFIIYLDDGTIVNEDVITSDFDNVSSSLLTNVYHGGAVVMTALDQPDVFVLDELWAVVESLCLRSISDLLNRNQVTVTYYSSPGDLFMTWDDANITMSGTYVKTAQFPGRELILGLYQCGRRYIALLQKLSILNSDYQVLVNSLEAYAQVAHANLRTASYL